MRSSEFVGRRVLVTGGAGFLGSHLCDRLIREGHYVVAVDDFTTGSRRNLAHLAEHPRFFFVQYDVTSPFSFCVDYVYNLASPASPPQYQRDPTRTLLTNVLGTYHALEVARKQGARFLQASTSEVYGDPTVHPQPESYLGNVNPIGVRACYDEGKRCAEAMVMDYRRKHGVDARIARIFNTYGPRMALDDGRVVSNFIVQALRGEDLTVYGSGQQTRSFCYVDDLVDGLVSLMSHESASGPVNLGNPIEFTIRELAEEVIRLSGSTSAVRFAPLPEDDPKQRKPDVALAAELFGFAPKTPLRAGLAKTIEHFRKELQDARRKTRMHESEGAAESAE